MQMNKEDKHFIEGYEKLLNKGYCNCNEMNCIDNNSPRRILNIVKQLQQENKELKEKINTYEDPEDLTLMFMYCNEKAKDKIKELHNKIDEISVFIKENKIKRYRPIEGEEYDEEIVLDEDDITCLERIINDEYDYENR